MEKLDTNNALFTNYIFKSIPLAFDESMSYYEVLSAILSYMKDTLIPTINTSIEKMNTIETKVDEYDAKFEEYDTKIAEIEEFVKDFKPYVDDKVSALRTEIIALIDDVKSTYLKKTDLTPQLLQTKMEGSNDVVVDVNETDDKLQVRLDDSVRSNVAKNPTLTLIQLENEDVKIKDTYTNLKSEDKSSEVALSKDDFIKDNDKVKINKDNIQIKLTAGANIVITEEGVISAIEGGQTSTDYNILDNKPKINDVILRDNIALSTLGLYGIEEIDLKESMLQECITEANEGTSTTATSDRSQGDLVFINGILYQCTTDITTGTTYSLDTNIKKIEVEDYVKSKQSQMKSYVDNQDSTLQANINAEQSARVDSVSALATELSTETNARKVADSELNTKISNEVTARQNADSNLQTNINSEITNRQNADTNLQTNIDKKQDTLVSGTNIKTINGNSIVGSGDVTISTGSIAPTELLETLSTSTTSYTATQDCYLYVAGSTSFTSENHLLTIKNTTLDYSFRNADYGLDNFISVMMPLAKGQTATITTANITINTIKVFK